MNAWLTDAATANIPNHDNGAFNNQTIDPTMAFLQQSPTPDPQFQRMYNGGPRNMSPGFPNPNSVIPSKRPRPDDGMSMSPRQAPSGLPGSRSQTPHQVPYPGYQAPVNGAPQFTQNIQAPTPYQHLQQQTGSANASPSPILQEFDQQAPQRVQTASPSPFSPAGGMHVGPQMSPSHSEHGSRVNTPQTGTFPPQVQPYGQPVGAHFSPSPAMTSGQMHPAMQAQFNQANANLPPGYAQQQQMNVQRAYQMQLQNHARQLQAVNPAAAGRPVAGGVNAMASPQVAAMRQMQQNMAKPTNPEGFLRVLHRFMISRGLPLDTNPIVSGRPLNLVQLYAAVMKLGGSKKVSAMNAWHVVAQQLQFPAMQYPVAPQEIREHYYRNLAAYEQAWLNSQQKQFGDQLQHSPQRPVHEVPGMPPQVSPAKPVNNHSFDMNQQFQVPAQPAMQQQNNVPSVPANGFATPPNKSQQKQPHHQQRSSLSRPPEAMPPNGQPVQFPNSASPMQVDKKATPISKRTTAIDRETNMPLQHPIEDQFKPTVLPESHFHGPVIVDELFQLGEDIIRLKPNVPSFAELGVIDIHALTMSIKSGIHAEMRVALDTLTQISFEPGVQISLDNCEDLVETLIECAEDQADLLAENAAEVSDVMLLPSYEEIMRGCRQEMETLVDVPEFGSLDYELDRAVDRLVCVTTIIRNFSFSESNFHLLAMPFVVKFMSTIIHYLGTRNMLLRTHQNTLDFMKDVVIYLSNLAHTIQLPGKDEALCLVHFLLSFAPTPQPTSFGLGNVMFTPYNPNIHKYLPAAVDSLAKLLARDDPNRTYYKSIFAQDSTSTPPYELLTRAFGLAIAPIPEQVKGNIITLADARKPFLMQGMLAAEILSGLADNNLARSWLASTDGFAVSLLRLACLLSTDRIPPPPTRHAQAARPADAEFHGYSSITSRAFTVLCRLAQKSKMADGQVDIPFGVLPKKENLLGALLTQNIDPNVVRQLCEFAALGG
ncbi:hypothetical protein AJ80_05242 [Polytolypa hystricis UAMH7299]|uniref:ARID domain-containing protein n=1 Tax=Polytolypa hystricis (strain UAMH7299) TaxID=1447883 RepID=A0A2B7Y517_POLH7|nr:hypothetical protein AJ80_05242 [Polytolypa hystricis UAMH7299]